MITLFLRCSKANFELCNFFLTFYRPWISIAVPSMSASHSSCIQQMVDTDKAFPEAILYCWCCRGAPEVQVALIGKVSGISEVWQRFQFLWGAFLAETQLETEFGTNTPQESTVEDSWSMLFFNSVGKNKNSLKRSQHWPNLVTRPCWGTSGAPLGGGTSSSMYAQCGMPTHGPKTDIAHTVRKWKGPKVELSLALHGVWTSKISISDDFHESCCDSTMLICPFHFLPSSRI